MKTWLPGAAGVALTIAAIGGWFQHLYTCFNHNLWGFLIAGAMFFPVGIIHGWGIWLGVWGVPLVEHAADRGTAAHVKAAIEYHNKAAEVLKPGENSIQVVPRSDREAIADYDAKALAEAEQADIAAMNRHHPGYGDHFRDEFIEGLRLIVENQRSGTAASAFSSVRGQMLVDKFGDWYVANVDAIRGGHR
jgi:hypothetical protein